MTQPVFDQETFEVSQNLIATTDDLERMFSLNVRGTHVCMRAAARIMIAQGRGGRIVTASSIASYRGKHHRSPHTHF